MSAAVQDIGAIASPLASAEAKAKSSSFYAGMRVLPAAERQAMFAIYAFCREVDDVADEGGLSHAERITGLDGWRRDLAALYAGEDAGQAAFLAPAMRRFGLELTDFLAVVDGMQMDVDADVRGPSLAELDLYCDRVASAVGRLSVKVFGMDAAPGEGLARHLGRALQLTNILRDLDEDASLGRLYLAREWLDAAGLDPRDPVAAVASPAIDIAAQACAALARTHYAEADRIMAARPKGRLAAPKLMSAVYGRILERTSRAGWAPPRRRISLSGAEKLLILARSLIGL